MNIKDNKLLSYRLLIVAIAALLFIPFLGGVHLFDWDEINFAESAREMIVSEDYLNVQINFKPFWEKPPLFIWMQVLSMKIFGINEFAARLPNAISGILTLLILFNIGTKLYDKKFGLIWALAYTGSFLPFLYFKSGIIDPWFNLFIFCGIYYLIVFTGNNGRKYQLYLIMSAVFIGLAVLTKGPVAILIFVLTVFIYWIINYFKLPLTYLNILIFAVILLMVGGFWFILQSLSGNFNVIVDFIKYQVRLFHTEDAGHGGFIFYHFIVLFAGVFPASVFALQGFIKHTPDKPYQRSFKKWMIVLFSVVLVLFTIVKTKIIHYSSLCYFPLTYLAAFTIYKVIKGEIKYGRWINFLLVPMGILYSLIVIALPFINKYKESLINSININDEFAIGNIRADVFWSGFESVIGLVLLSGVILFMFNYRVKNFRKGILYLFISSVLFVYLSILFITPRIEKYSQNAAIEFFKDLKNKDVYVGTIGYKSYAHLFYTEKKMPVNRKSYDMEWLLSGDIDKKAYFSMKKDKKNKLLAKYPELKVLYEKNGFVFCVRNDK